MNGLSLSSPAAINDQYLSATNNTQLFTGLANSATAGERYLSFTLAAPSIAFGLDLNAYSSSLTVNALGVSQSVGSFPSFFGVIDPASAATVFTVSHADSRVLGPLTFDNVSTATAATSVPEPASLAPLGAGLLGAGALRRRR